MKPFKIKKEKKEVTTNVTDSQNIYSIFKHFNLEMKDISKAYTEQKEVDNSFDFSFEQFKLVSDEMIRLYDEMKSKMSGTYILEEAIPAEYDKEDNKTKAEVPVVYFKVKTKQALIDSLSSDLLEIDTFINDMIVYDDGNYDIDRTWEEFITLFSNETI